MDRRTTPANGRVAAAELKGIVEAESFVAGGWATMGRPAVDLLAAPDGPRDRQLLFGQRVRVFEERDGFAFVQAERDGYVGYVPLDALADPFDASHTVCTPATHAYPAPNMKRKEVMHLSFGARVRVVFASGNFFETAEGWFIPKPHLRPANKPMTDPATVSQMHFGVPYLWGGNSVLGIDCSGLIQAACLACGIACPGDSDQQERVLGDALPAGTPPQRGDLFFWKGHVAMAVDGDTLIHANAHHMAVAYEPIEAAIARIAEQGDGPVTAHKRM